MVSRLRVAHYAEVAAWIGAGSKGDRPPASAERLQAERLLGEVSAVAANADPELPLARADYAIAAEHVREATFNREQALWSAVVEAAEPALEQLERPVAGVPGVEVRLQSLVSALREAANGGAASASRALGAAAEIEERIATARRRLAVARDPIPGAV